MAAKTPIPILLTEEQHWNLKFMAKLEGISCGEIVRRLIDDKYERRFDKEEIL